MSSEYREPSPDPNVPHRHPTSELWGAWGPLADDQAQSVPPSKNEGDDPQEPFAPREHVSGSLAAYPSEAPLFRPAYIPYPTQPGYPSPPPRGSGYPAQVVPSQPTYQGHPGYPAYPGYPPHPYGYPPYAGYPAYQGRPVQPKRDGYLFAMNIVATVGASIVLLAGLGSAIFVLLLAVVHPRTISDSQYFSGLLTLTGFACAGIIGGGFSLYQCIRSFMRKASASFALPWFWIFILLYIGVIAAGFGLQVNGQEVAYPVLTVFLIILAAIFPALALLALGDRRLRFPTWATTWRRFTLAITSGATLGVGLALVLELVLLFLLVRGQSAINVQGCLTNPDPTSCQTSAAFNIIFITVAIIGPLVEETVKPLAVVIFIGRVRSAAEAFVLGLACGIGFALVETVGYIGSGYHDWLSVALERTGAGLLHGFGSAMVALGWYYLTHDDQKHRILKALGCWVYAVFQHFAWNATATLPLFPSPIGSTVNSWNLNLGFVSLPFIEVLNIIEAILILVFFLYITGKLRTKTPSSLKSRPMQPIQEPQMLTQT